MKIKMMACALALMPCFVKAGDIKCDKWIVVTSIYRPTRALEQLAALPDWQLVVVADKKTPKDWQLPGCIFLSVEQQEQLGYQISKLLPWNHYCRKNIGYLYAIEHGARIIYDTDDDNYMLDGALHYLPEKSDCLRYETQQAVFNPYDYFGQSSVWPRGYPLKAVTIKADGKFTMTNDLFMPIQQGLVNKDPDVDAIFRLTRNEYIDFLQGPPVAINHKVMTPFNSQNTLFYQSAFWGLLMPMSTTWRVADIWRGYWAQRLLWDLNGFLCFLPPTAYQDRNEHDLLKDFIQESDVYCKVDTLIQSLNEWHSDKDGLFDRMEDLFEMMVKNQFFGPSDLELAQAWIADLKTVGYIVPEIVR